MSFGSILQEARPHDRKFAQTLKNMAPKRVQKVGLKSQILGLFEFRKHLAGSKTTQQKLSVDFEENCSKKSPKRGPEIADPSAV